MKERSQVIPLTVQIQVLLRMAPNQVLPLMEVEEEILRHIRKAQKVIEIKQDVVHGT